jgi:Plasmid encoded RepA protein
MTKKRGDDQYGYDPDRATARSVLDHLERQAEQRPDKQAEQIGAALNVRKVRKVTPKDKRLIDAHVAIVDSQPDERAYLHTVLCQTSLPYKPTDKRVWIRDQGAASLLIEAGHARHPGTGEWVELGLPHGERPRLILIHLGTEAVRTGSPTIEVGASLTAFARSLGIDTNGPSIRRFKDQLARLTASTVRLGVITDGRATQTNTQFVSGIDLWMPKDADQRVLWPSTVTLSAEYFDSLQQHAVPLDPRAIRGLAGSALDLDIYAWLAQRLHRIDPNKPQTISWQALKSQFGPDYDRLRDFRRKFVPALKTVLTVYPSARIEVADADTGLVLQNSPPPVSKRLVSVQRLNPPTIDATATEIPDT